jgi:PadR family transcriptional regulator, regulatory protein PadR
MNVQYKKGVLELCILALLYDGDRYGYDVSEYLSKHVDISDGTVYPILRKLKNDGLVTVYLSEESGGPPRKYYSITEPGREEYLHNRDEWLAFAKIIEGLLKGEIHHD